MPDFRGTCPKGHTFTRHRVSEHGVKATCDECKYKFIVNARTLCCEVCDFDLCEPCASIKNLGDRRRGDARLTRDAATGVVARECASAVSERAAESDRPARHTTLTAGRASLHSYGAERLPSPATGIPCRPTNAAASNDASPAPPLVYTPPLGAPSVGAPPDMPRGAQLPDVAASPLVCSTGAHGFRSAAALKRKGEHLGEHSPA